MNKKIYKAAVDDIRADSKLINETAKKMQETNRSKHHIYRYGTLAACMAIVLVSVFFLQNMLNKSSSGYPVHLSAGKTITLTDGKGKIYINEVGRSISSKLRVPEGSYSKDLSMSELNQYFGRNPLPTTSKDFKPESNSVNIMFNADGSIFYMSPLRYYKGTNDEVSPKINIQLDKGKLPIRDCFYKGNVEKESVIGNTKLVIGSIQMGEKFTDQGTPTEYYDVYYSQFIYNGIGYNISAERVDGDMFIGLLESIIK